MNMVFSTLYFGVCAESTLQSDHVRWQISSIQFQS